MEVKEFFKTFFEMCDDEALHCQDCPFNLKKLTFGEAYGCGCPTSEDIQNLIQRVEEYKGE